MLMEIVDDDAVAVAASILHMGMICWQVVMAIGEEKQKRKESRAKRILNNDAVGKMTVARLNETDLNKEIRGWLTTISHIVAIVDA